MTRRAVSLWGFVVAVIIFTQGIAASDDSLTPVLPPPVEITTENIASCYAGDDYSTQISATGGSGDIVFSADTLPAFLKIKKNGRLKGRVMSPADEFRLTIIATDKKFKEHGARRDYTLTVYPAMEIHEYEPKAATAGYPYQHRFHIKGGSGTLRAVAEGLPDGLSMDGDGIVSGTPSAKPGRYTCVLTVNDLGPLGKTLKKKFKLKVYPELTAECQNPGPVLVRSRLTVPVRVSGGSGSYRFYSTDLPQGLTVSSSGSVQGTVDVRRGRYPYTLHIEDKKTGIVRAEKQEITVVDYFPDVYEAMNDDGFDTGNHVGDGAGPQHHTLDKPGDRDTVTMDFGSAGEGSVICIDVRNGVETSGLFLTLYNAAHDVVAKLRSDHSLQYFFTCEKNGVYYVRFETGAEKTGDFTFEARIMGKAVTLSNETLADVSRVYDRPQKLSAADGSGSHRFSPVDLPDGLDLDPDGILNGRAAVPPGQYPVKIRVDDRLYPGIFHEKEYTISVVDYFPDDYEKAGDQDVSTANTLKPGDPPQNHTFNTVNDDDVIKIDLAGIPDSHVIRVETVAASSSVKPELGLFDASNTRFQSPEGVEPEGQTEAFFQKKAMDAVFVRIKEPEGKTGEYRIQVRDMGSCVTFAGIAVPDALRRGAYTHKITAENGSGRYHFTARNLPGSLAMDGDGVIQGQLDLEPGRYPISVTVEDRGYPGTSAEKDAVLCVVDYFPDAFENMGDSDHHTANALVLGSGEQKHTFHRAGDVDMMRLNLEQCRPGDVIRVIVPGAEEGGALTLELQDLSGTVLGRAERTDSKETIRIVHICQNPGVLYLKAVETHNGPGCYSVRADHCGPKIELTEAALPYGESDAHYSMFLRTRGGTGKVSYSVSQGALPEGLNLDETTGEISGRNRTWGHTGFSVTAKDVQFPENRDTRTFSMETYMGRKLDGTAIVEFPHYVSGAFSWDEQICSTTAFPGRIEGGTPGHLRYRMVSHNIPPERFGIRFDEETGWLNISEKIPLACKQYTETDLFAEIRVEDSVHTNNTFTIRYEMPVRCFSDF